jgi:hypothetical protein
VTLGLNVARLTGHPGTGPALSMGLLAVAGGLAAVSGAGATGASE